jgi:hypothetical protein
VADFFFSVGRYKTETFSQLQPRTLTSLIRRNLIGFQDCTDNSLSRFKSGWQELAEKRVLLPWPW